MVYLVGGEGQKMSTGILKEIVKKQQAFMSKHEKDPTDIYLTKEEEGQLTIEFSNNRTLAGDIIKSGLKKHFEKKNFQFLGMTVHFDAQKFELKYEEQKPIPQYKEEKVNMGLIS